jgi:hypothetical protein
VAHDLVGGLILDLLADEQAIFRAIKKTDRISCSQDPAGERFDQTKINEGKESKVFLGLLDSAEQHIAESHGFTHGTA